jgi:hypothetical protein
MDMRFSAIVSFVRLQGFMQSEVEEEKVKSEQAGGSTADFPFQGSSSLNPERHKIPELLQRPFDVQSPNIGPPSLCQYPKNDPSGLQSLSLRL